MKFLPWKVPAALLLLAVMSPAAGRAGPPVQTPGQANRSAQNATDTLRTTGPLHTEHIPSAAVPPASPVGARGHVGCDANAKRVTRLVINKPGVYSNYLVDGRWGDHTLVKINADGVTLRNCEIRNSTGNAVTVYAKDVLIESCKIHHALAGTFDQQRDAHGITGRPENLVIRNCEIGLVSGDAIQFDPGRGPWGQVLVEHCTLWTGPLPADAAGFRRGQRPGENAVDTKQRRTNPRSRLTIRSCLMFGWNQPGQITNMAALNLKDHVQVIVTNCILRDNEIGFRIRGVTGERGGAQVTIDHCAVYDSAIGLRIEDQPQNFVVRQLGIGQGIDRAVRIVSSDKPTYSHLDLFTPGAYETLLHTGVWPPSARLRGEP